jgi:hypothetical protein
METKIRIRLGDIEVECTGDDVFVTTRLPELVSDLLRRMADRSPASTPQPSDPQPSSEPRPVSIAGTLLNYFSEGPIQAARVTATGLLPEIGGTTDAAGRYAFSGHAAGGECFLSVADVNNFSDTTTGPFNVTSSPLTLNAFAASTADVNRQYTVLGLPPSRSLAMVIVHLIDASGGPLEMVPASDLLLIAEDGSPIGDGPFFFGPAGDVQSQQELMFSRAFNGRARAAFLSVPAGDCIVQLTANSSNGLERVTARVRANRGTSIVDVALSGQP